MTINPTVGVLMIVSSGSDASHAHKLNTWCFSASPAWKGNKNWYKCCRANAIISERIGGIIWQQSSNWMMSLYSLGTIGISLVWPCCMTMPRGNRESGRSGAVRQSFNLVSDYRATRIRLQSWAIWCTVIGYCYTTSTNWAGETLYKTLRSY